MRRQFPLIITFFIGTLIVISEFIPHKPFGNLSDTFYGWFLIISGFAIILGQLNLFKVNLIKISRKSPNWRYYIIALVSFIIMVLFGLLWGTQKHPGLLTNTQPLIDFLGRKPFDYLFKYFFENLSATMFSLLAFFVASASYRAFRARSPESTLLLTSAVLVMLGRTTIGTWITGWVPESLTYLHLPNIANFIMEYLNTAAQRAIMICAGLGVVGSSLRIILGIERSYLGGK
ncbi:MAG: hypothetical protein U9R23_07345 [Candidatus Cloacimonadota bacterium]|nr:hypothetical protein [Candidatus Cloacimonadota bacterium]